MGYTPGEGGFVAFDGIDGAGKSTLCEAIQQGAKRALASVAVASTFYRPQDDTLWSLYRDAKDMELFASEEDQMFHAITTLATAKDSINAARQGHDLTIADRYLFGRLVLARLVTGENDSRPERLLWSCLEKQTLPVPDTTYVLRVPAGIAMQRVRHRGGRLEERETLPELARAACIIDELLELPRLAAVLPFEVLDGAESSDILAEHIIEQSLVRKQS